MLKNQVAVKLRCVDFRGSFCWVCFGLFSMGNRMFLRLRKIRWATVVNEPGMWGRFISRSISKMQQLELEESTSTWGISDRIHLLLHFISDVSGRFIETVEDIGDRVLHKTPALQETVNNLWCHWPGTLVGEREGIGNEGYSKSENVRVLRW